MIFNKRGFLAAKSDFTSMKFGVISTGSIMKQLYKWFFTAKMLRKTQSYFFATLAPSRLSGDFNVFRWYLTSLTKLKKKTTGIA